MRTESAWAAFLRPWRRLPVTSGVIALCAALFLIVEWDRTATGGDWEAELRRWGGVAPQEYSQQVGPLLIREPELRGPFDLWSGEWWRVPVSALHHANLLHLLTNCLSLWALGLLLEPRLGRGRYLLFLIAAATISMLPEFMRGQYAVGISGAICAMFGMLLVVRRRDPIVATVLTDSVVWFAFAWLIGGIILTMLEIVPMANAAHFTGLAYGWLAGQVVFGRWAHRRLPRFLFLAGHLALLPAFWYVTHPIGNGSYHWYLAYRDPERQMTHLQRAVEVDPTLDRVWGQLALQQIQQGNKLAAWRTALAALDGNRFNERLVRFTRAVWDSLQTREERRQARDELQQRFGDEIDAWERRLAIDADITWPERHPPPSEAHPAEADRLALERPLDLSPRLYEPGDLPPHDPPPFDPQAPDSAVEGVRL